MKHIILFNILLLNLVLATIAAKAQPCYIVYSYDNAGNRISRVYSCYPNTTGPGPVLKQVHGTGTGAVSGSDTTIANTCSLYPNPSNGRFSAVLKYPAHEANVYIMDEKGAVISRKEMDGTETSFDISQYPPGVYVLHLKDKSYEFEAKVVKE